VNPRGIAEIDASHLSREKFDSDIRSAGKPLVLRGLVADWPLVKMAKDSDAALFDYLKTHDTGHPQNSLIGKSEDKGHFFFSDDLRGQNLDWRKDCRANSF